MSSGGEEERRKEGRKGWRDWEARGEKGRTQRWKEGRWKGGSKGKEKLTGRRRE